MREGTRGGVAGTRRGGIKGGMTREQKKKKKVTCGGTISPTVPGSKMGTALRERLREKRKPIGGWTKPFRTAAQENKVLLQGGHKRGGKRNRGKSEAKSSCLRETEASRQ